MSIKNILLWHIELLIAAARHAYANNLYTNYIMMQHSCTLPVAKYYRCIVYKTVYLVYNIIFARRYTNGIHTKVRHVK